ncbi:aminoacyl-tRNA hydrolase [Sulfoacidibacillus thermotolerans]|uniref:Peptidyl-tRNA hydrolase n=1 Tax=Sulfoacidibacillus thermotolerans TaxID=1765684 RepID=A0A2U3DAY4_SULT2|nr:aminoacyl-tRNA hydrolase [Sulfoacidibacillus thermotolerans]PWI58444.1 aminoacyl-tRNA hydrolase [Sulfoacidibacillus thermotolerans]
MSKLIVGLGNPGKEYEKTRHNVGFMVIDSLAQSLGIVSAKEKWRSLVAESMVEGERVYLMRPQTYMNVSGEAIRAAVDYLKLDRLSEQLLVIYDDMDLPIGKVRLREKGSAGGHNGVKSIIWHLGTEEFPRIRVGIGHPPADVAVVDYVLSRFSKVEHAQIALAVEYSAKAALAFCNTPFPIVMNAFN